jgi:hypothetical protein
VRFAGYRSTAGTTATGRGRRGPRPPERKRRRCAVERRRRPGRRRRRDNRARVVFAPGAGGAWRRWRCSEPQRGTRRLPGWHRGCAREAAAAEKPRPRSRGRRRRSPRTCDQVPCGENLADAPEVVKRETTRTVGPRKRRAVRAQVNVALVLAAVFCATSVGDRSRCAATDRGAAASSTAERRRTPSSLDRPGVARRRSSSGDRRRHSFRLATRSTRVAWPCSPRRETTLARTPWGDVQGAAPRAAGQRRGSRPRVRAASGEGSARPTGPSVHEVPYVRWTCPVFGDAAARRASRCVVR